MSIEDTLAQVPLFSQLSRRDLRRLARGAVSRHFGKGDIIVKEGEQAVVFYFVGSGSAEVVKGAEGASSRVLGTLGPGDFFGERHSWTTTSARPPCGRWRTPSA